MNNFMRFFNKNQKNIFLAVAVVIFVILIIVILNQYYIAQEENNQKIAQDKQLTTENGYSNQENVTLDNIEEIGKIGVDVVSSGALTHSVKALDISMKNLKNI